MDLNINYGEEKDLNFLELVNPCDELRKQRVDRRTSERIQMNMMEKLSGNQDKNNKKRTNEGITINSSNSFSILGHDDIIDKGIHMGVNLGSCDYESIDMLKDLENARLALHEKMKATVTSDSNTDKGMNLSQNEHEDDINLLDWMEEGKSEEEDFVLVTLRDTENLCKN